MESLNVLRWMYRWNRGAINEFPSVHLEREGDGDVPKTSKGCGAIFKSFWQQTAPLFRRPLALNFSICCFLMFGVFFVSAGIGLWFPEIQNRISTSQGTEELQTVCGVLESVLANGNKEVVNGTFRELVNIWKAALFLQINKRTYLLGM